MAKSEPRRAKAKKPGPRKGHPKSRPLPTPEPDFNLPPLIKRVVAYAAVGTLDAPVGASASQVYLAAARALIAEAQRLAKVSL